MHRLVLTLLLLSGCYQYDVGERTKVVESNYRDILYEVVELWNEDTSLPRATCNINNVYIALPTNKQFRENSGGDYCPPDEIVGCTTSSAAAYTLHEDRLIGGNTKYLIVIAAVLNQEERESVVAHEALHWLSFCTGHTDSTPDGGVGYPYYNGDSRHADPRLWGINGILRKMGY